MTTEKFYTLTEKLSMAFGIEKYKPGFYIELAPKNIKETLIEGLGFSISRLVLDTELGGGVNMTVFLDGINARLYIEYSDRGCGDVCILGEKKVKHRILNRLLNTDRGERIKITIDKSCFILNCINSEFDFSTEILKVILSNQGNWVLESIEDVWEFDKKE